MEFKKLLQLFYHFSDADYQSWLEAGDLNLIPDPSTKTLVFNPMIQAIKDGIESHKKFIVYGDYDVDGITSTAILVATLRELGAEVGFFIPSRYKEGYGLNLKRVEEFAKKNYQILITVDNGITRFEEIKRAKELGLTVIVIDHHEARDVLPEADHIFHQFLANYTDYNISGAFLSLVVSKGLLSRFDPYFVTLAGLAVFSDIMPLKGANVTLVKSALTNLNDERYKSLLLLAKPNSPIDQNLMNYDIIPALNAPGRLKEGLEVNDCVRLLLAEKDGSKPEVYANRLLAINQERKSMVLQSFDASLVDSKADIIFYKSTLPVGLGGLLANKIVTIYAKPTLVYSLIPDSELVVCSLRTPKNYDIQESFKKIPLNLFKDFGGHKNAAGCSLDHEHLEEFINLLKEVLLPLEDDKIERPLAIAIGASDLSIDNYNILKSFAPFGNEHEEPRFMVSVPVSSFKPLNNPKHLGASIGESVRIIFFNGEGRLPANGSVELVGRMVKNTFYRDQKHIDFIVESLFSDEYELLHS